MTKEDSDEFLEKKSDFFIELVDSSYWEISSKSEETLENIKKYLVV